MGLTIIEEYYTTTETPNILLTFLKSEQFNFN